MTNKFFKICLLSAALLFTIIFCLLIIPAFIENPDVVVAFAAGFVNPFAAGYSTDVIFCWIILAVWVRYEASTLNIKYGWICLVLGVVPGVAVGFAVYLFIRHSQLMTRNVKNA